MTGDRVQDVFLEVCDLPSAERARRLDELCVGDGELRKRVERLLLHDAAEDDCLGDAALETSHPPVARLLAGATEIVTDVPDRIGGFRVLEKLGEGGMGAVYLAEQDHPHRRVALKMIRPGVMTKILRRRFRAEAEILGRLQHPGIAQIHEAGEADLGNGLQPYFAMEYVRGPEIRRYAHERRLGGPERLELVARIADAVHHAHSRGVVHRDLKPENVLVSEEPAASLAGVPARFAGLGQPKVLDFGVARATDSDLALTTMHTKAGEILGTLTYMSPEQIAGRHEELDARSDVYALGVILYELLAGTPPRDFRRMTIVGAARAAEQSDPARLGDIDSACRGDVETIVGKALEKDPDRRYPTAAEFATDLRRHLANEPIAARRPSAAYQLRKFSRRHRGLVAGLAAAFAILVAGIVATTTFAVRASRQAELAERREREARAATYRFSLAAVNALGTDDPIQALRHLEDAPDEQRGWEWAFLDARLRSHVVLLEGDARCKRAVNLVRDEAGRLRALLLRDGGLEIVDVLDGKVLRRVPVDGVPTVTALSPDGSRLAVWSEAANRLDLWDVAGGRRLFALETALAPKGTLSFDTTGRRLALPRIAELSVHETSRGELVLHRREDGGRPMHTVFGPRGGGLIYSAARERSVDLISYVRLSAEGREVARRSHYPDCYALALAPDGRTVAVGARRRVLLLDAATLELVREFRWFPTSVCSVAFSPDGRFLAAASGNLARLFDISGEAETRTFSTMAGATSVAFSGDGSYLAVGSTGEVRAFDLRSTEPRVLEGHESYVYHVAFSPDGSLLASTDFDDGVVLWDAWTGERLASTEAELGSTAIQFSGDGITLLVGRHRDGTPRRTWDPLTRHLGTAEAGSDLLRGLTGDYEESTGYQEFRQVHSREGALRLRHNSKFPVIVTENGVERGRLGDGRPGTVLGIALTPDRARAATGHADGTVSLWDLATGAELAHAGGHHGRVYALEFSPDGSRLVSGANDGLVIVRDPGTLVPLVKLRGHESYVHDLDFSPDGRRLASASGDGTVRIWDATPALERFRHIRRMRALRAQAAARVDRLRERFESVGEIVETLRADPELGPDLRRECLLYLTAGRLTTGGR